MNLKYKTLSVQNGTIPCLYSAATMRAKCTVEQPEQALCVQHQRGKTDAQVWQATVSSRPSDSARVKSATGNMSTEN